MKRPWAPACCTVYDITPSLLTTTRLSLQPSLRLLAVSAPAAGRKALFEELSVLP